MTDANMWFFPQKRKRFTTAERVNPF